MGKSGLKAISVKFNNKYSTPHQFFIKQHKVREESDDRPSESTLFVSNVPPYCTEESLKRLFQSCGSVKAVYFAGLNSPSEVCKSEEKCSIFDKMDEIAGYKVAYVVFQSSSDLQNALTWQPSEPASLSSDAFSVITGLRKWCQEYNSSFSNPSEMQKEIDEFMRKYDKELINDEKLKKQNAEPDDSGWVTVTKKGRNPGFARKQSVKDNIMRKLKRKKKRNELLNFYTFQIKESKMNHLTKLREKFEDDKKKIEQLKTRRKFKPF